MKRTLFFVAIVALVALALIASASSSVAQGPGPQSPQMPQAQVGTGFTYQGQLKNASGPVTGVCDMAFQLHSDASANAPVGSAITPTVPITSGLFTVQLDFGAGAFNGDARWLAIAVRCPAGSGSFSALTPRQPLTPAPYALALPGLYTQQNGTSPNVIGGYSGNGVTAGVYGATIGGGGETSFPNIVTDNYGTVGGGRVNQAGDATGTVLDGSYATVGGGDGNIAAGQYATIPGGRSNVAGGDYSFAGGRKALASYEGAFVWADSTDANFASTAANQFLIRAGGGVGIGVNNPAAQLHVTGTNVLNTAVFQSSRGPNASNIHYGATGDWYIRSAANTGKVVLQDTGGNVGIGTNTPDSARTLHVAGALRVDGTLRVDMLAGAGGQVCYNVFTNEIATCSSSLRYKDNVADLDLGLATVAQLRPVTFAWKSTGEPDLGFVAEEVSAIAPILTTRNAEGQVEGVKYDRLTAVLVQAAQEQQAQIAELKAQNAQLEARLAALEARLNGASAASPGGAPVNWLLSLGGLLALSAVIVQRRRTGGRQ